MKNLVFICGSDTGSGKTVLTGLLTGHARLAGIDAVALKPFCSGSRDDVRFLQMFQNACLPDDTVNPWFFEKPLSPYAAIKSENSKNIFKRPLNIDSAVQHIKSVCDKHRLVFVEGIGGLMVPITKNFLFIDLISRLKAHVILTSKNKLGTINHTLLSVEILKKFKIKCLAIVLMNEEIRDLSADSNSEIISEFSGSIATFEIPFLRDKNPGICQDKKISKILKKILALI
jgi:dethiobiotin synthetase